MKRLSIQLPPPGDCPPDESCPIRIAIGDLILTRLLRQPGSQPDDAVIAPPAALAFWLCDNWWRLRWETRSRQEPSADWLLAHELTSAGGGCAWPRLSIWGDSDRVALLGRADPVGVVGPVRYLTDGFAYVEASDFETEIDRVLDRISDDRTGFGSDRSALRALVAALREERGDPERALWRRLEARLGYDPDDCPDEVIEATGALAEQYGLDAVEEAVAATPGADASSLLTEEITLAKERGKVCNFSAVLSQIDRVPRRSPEPPWIAAEEAAARVREACAIGSGPIPPARLADLLGTTRYSFRQTARAGDRAYGLRLHADDSGERQRVSLRHRDPRSRRFELCRALGDTLWSRGESMGPLTDTSTARQRFQRAFAQSLLCPFKDLLAFLDTDRPDDDDIESAATHFHVSTRLVETLLVNKGLIDRARVEDRLEAA